MRRISAEVVFLSLVFFIFLIVIGFGFLGVSTGDRLPWSLSFEWFSPVQAELKMSGSAVALAFSLFFLLISYFGLRNHKKASDPAFDLPLALSALGALFSWVSRTPLLSLIGLVLTILAGCIFLSRWGQRSSADRKLLIPFGLGGFISILATAVGISWGSELGALICLFFASVFVSKVYPFHAWVFDDSRSNLPERAIALGYLPVIALMGVISGISFSGHVRDQASGILWLGVLIVLIHQLATLGGSGIQKVLEAGQAILLLFCLCVALWVGPFPALVLATVIGTSSWVIGQWVTLHGSKPEPLHLAILAVCALAVFGFPLFITHQALAHVIQDLTTRPLILLPLSLIWGTALLHISAVFGRVLSLDAGRRAKKPNGIFWLIPPLLPFFAVFTFGVVFGGWKDLEIGRWFMPIEQLFRDSQLTLAPSDQAVGLGGYFGALSIIVGLGWLFSNRERSKRLYLRMERVPGGGRLVELISPRFHRASRHLDSVLSEKSWEKVLERPLIQAARTSSRGFAQTTRLSDEFFLKIGKMVIHKLNVVGRELQNGDIQRYLLFSIFASAMMALLLLGMR